MTSANRYLGNHRHGYGAPLAFLQSFNQRGLDPHVAIFHICGRNGLRKDESREN